MTTGRLFVTVVDDADGRAQVEQVRIAAFRQAAEFRWHDEQRLAWSDADEAGVVLALRDAEGRVLSTVRATCFADLAAAEEMLEYSLAGLPVQAPLIVASRAATRPGAGRGWLTYLRRAYVATALSLPEVRHAITLVYEGAPRLRSMREAGFDFHVPPQGWDSEALALAQPLLAALPRPRFARALEVMAAACGDAPEPVGLDGHALAAVLRGRVVNKAARARRDLSVERAQHTAP